MRGPPWLAVLPAAVPGAAAAQLDAATTLAAHERGYRLARSLGESAKEFKSAQAAIDSVNEPRP